MNHNKSYQGRTIRKQRMRLDMTRAELAARLGVKEALIADVEEGRCQFYVPTFAQKLAAALNLTVDGVTGWGNTANISGGGYGRRQERSAGSRRSRGGS